MKRFFLTILELAICFAVYGQNINIEQPKTENGSTFAIVIDNITFSKCQKQVYAYRDALEKDGLSTYIIRGDWENPDQVKEEIKKVYSENTDSFEGIVLIGDIPVVMIRNAQNLTRLFKMNENKFEKGRSSVPSDRFYDDLGLDFEFITKSSSVNGAAKRELFFYNLKPESRQYLSPNFYSGRIMFPKEFKGDGYKEIGKFLEKAAAAHINPPQMGKMLLTRGALSESECFYSRAAGIELLKEQVPFLSIPSKIQTIDFSKDYPSVKDRLLAALQQKQFSVFNYRGHGNLGLMASGFPPAGNGEIKDAEILSLPIQAYYIMLNSCFNGAFFRGRDMAGAFLFSPGNVLAVQAVGVNSHQDEWDSRYMGIIYAGARIGEYHRLAPLLERNIIGDPAFHFKTAYDYDLKDAVTKFKGDKNYWKNCLEKGLPPEVEGSRNNSLSCVAVNQLCAMGELSSSEMTNLLWGKMYPSILLECINQVQFMYGKGCDSTIKEDYFKILGYGIASDNEFVVRQTGMKALLFSDPRLCDNLIYGIKSNLNRKRSLQNVFQALGMIPEDVLRKAFDSHPLKNDRAVAQKFEEAFKVLYKQKHIQHLVITDKNTSSDRRIVHSTAVKNTPYPDFLPLFLNMVADKSLNTELRMVLADALGWYEYSYIKQDVIDGIKNLLSDPSFDATMRNSLNKKVSLRDVLVKSLNRLEN